MIWLPHYTELIQRDEQYWGKSRKISDHPEDQTQYIKEIDIWSRIEGFVSIN